MFVMSTGIDADLSRLVGRNAIRRDPVTREMHGFDAFLSRAQPSAVVEPQTAQEVAALVRYFADNGIPYLVRGAATGYAGGVVPVNGEIVVSMRRLNRIRRLDVAMQVIDAEAGVTTGTVKALAAEHGLYYPPDPSSYAVSTIGGNVATNAGGPHCLGYGVTDQYVLEIECVDAGGSLWRLGTQDARLDLRGLVVGSEGTLAVVTAVAIRLIEQPSDQSTIVAAFDENVSAIEGVQRIVTTGASPIALDMVSRVFHPDGKTFSFPNRALLFIETAGSTETVLRETTAIQDVLAGSSSSVSLASRVDYMRARFAATRERCIGIIRETDANGYFLFDSVVRRSDLSKMIGKLEDIARSFGFILANTFHAGDGNIHPTPFFDRRDPGHIERLGDFLRNVMSEVRELGGIPTGEHGVGIEKADVLADFHSRASYEALRRVKAKLDPGDRLARGKVLASPAVPRCVYRPTAFEHALAECLANGAVVASPVDGYVIAPGNVAINSIHDALRDTAFRCPYLPVIDHETASLDMLLRSGVRSLTERRYGHPRNLLLGALLRVKSGDQLALGSLYAKDVAGYGLRRLLFGSRELLGILDVVVLRVAPRPPCARTIVIGGLPEGAAPDALLHAYRQARAVLAGYAHAWRGERPHLILHFEGCAQEVGQAVEAARAAAGGVATAELVPGDLSPSLGSDRPDAVLPLSSLEAAVVDALAG
jgi:glycolate oxidase